MQVCAKELSAEPASCPVLRSKAGFVDEVFYFLSFL